MSHRDDTHRVPRDTDPTVPLPPEPEDVDALLSESLKAQSERDFTWKEPERKPRWWERAETLQSEPAADALASRPTGALAPTEREGRRVRLGSAIFALVALVLAGWVVASVALGVTIDPLVVGLVICSLAGIALIGAGLRPKPGTRI